MWKRMTGRQLRSLIAAIFLVFCYGLVNNTLGYFLEPVTRQFGCGRAAFSLYFTILSGVSLVMTPVYGQILQRIPIRRVLMVCGTIGALCLFAYSLCPSIRMFYVIAVPTGLVHNGATMVTAVVIINRAFTTDNGSATGLAMAGTGICSALMGLILPRVIESRGWHAGYRTQAVIWVILFVLTWLLLADFDRNTGKAEKGNSDNAEKEPLPGVTMAQAMKMPAFYIFIVVGVLYIVSIVFVQHLPAYFVELGLTPVTAGSVMSIFSIFLIVFKILLGGMYDRFGPYITTIAATACYMAGFALIRLPGYPLLIAGCAFMAFGMSSGTVLLPLFTKEIFGTREFAAIYGVVSMGTAIGNAIGSPLWGIVYDVSGSYSAVPFLSTGIMALSTVVVLLLIRGSSRTMQETGKAAA